ncbi:hypothetical protein JCM16358_24130 [Halanaerocella petrolearia]
MKKQSKSIRVLSIFERLNQGRVINRKSEAEKFSVSSRTIKRDIDTLRNYLSQLYEDGTQIIYNRDKKGYILQRDQKKWLTNRETLSLVKVLLESRAFSDQEMNQLLDKLILQSNFKDQKHIEQVICNERFHYQPLKHQ